MLMGTLTFFGCQAHSFISEDFVSVLQDGWTPLHLAVQSRRTDVVRLLLIKGADKTIKNQVDLIEYVILHRIFSEFICFQFSWYCKLLRNCFFNLEAVCRQVPFMVELMVKTKNFAVFSKENVCGSTPLPYKPCNYWMAHFHIP